jgi:hypothetical protein
LSSVRESVALGSRKPTAPKFGYVNQSAELHVDANLQPRS